MKKIIVTLTILTALVLSLAGCGKARPAETAAPQATAEAQPTAEPAPAEPAAPQPAPAETPAPAPAVNRQDGERFEATIMLEGMEETVNYEHVRRADLGFEMDYDYDMFVRQSGADFERFVSVWDNNPADPVDYLEVRYDSGNAGQVADAVNAALSGEYDTTVDTRKMDNGVQAIRIEASVIKGTNQMADQIDVRYIVPAADGCRVVKAHYWTADSEGYARRIAYLIFTLSAFDRSGGEGLTDDQAIAAIAKYCAALNPDLEEIVNAGDYPAYWEIESGDAQEVVVLFRSYTGALVRYYIDRTTGDTRVTEFVPGITPEEMPSEESLNAWDYV